MSLQAYERRLLSSLDELCAIFAKCLRTVGCLVYIGVLLRFNRTKKIAKAALHCRVWVIAGLMSAEMNAIRECKIPCLDVKGRMIELTVPV